MIGIIGAGPMIQVKSSGKRGLVWQGGVIGEYFDRKAENTALEKLTKDLNTRPLTKIRED
jgi:hypothetical protein